MSAIMWWEFTPTHDHYLLTTSKPVGTANKRRPNTWSSQYHSSAWEALWFASPGPKWTYPPLQWFRNPPRDATRAEKTSSSREIRTAVALRATVRSLGMVLQWSCRPHELRELMKSMNLPPVNGIPVSNKTPDADSHMMDQGPPPRFLQDD